MPLLQQWHDALSRGDSIEAAEDHRVAPVLLEHVTAALLAVADRGQGGIYQVSAAGDVSYAEIATWIADRLQIDRTRVAARAAVDIGIPASDVLPYTSLDASRLAALTGQPAPQPSLAIEKVLASLR
jgi:dTDP-4-dehydrorhamnose reductase